MGKAILLFFMVVISTITYGQENLIQKNLSTAIIQYKAMDIVLPNNLFPRSVNNDGSLMTNESHWWTSGFYPGSLWYLFEYSGDTAIYRAAIKKLKVVEIEKKNYRDHDIGFKIFCSFGNAYRITSDTSYIPIIITAAQTLTKRFNPKVGCIRSWDNINDSTQFRVIIDNMMNLELLFWATKQTGDPTFYKIAVSHANKTLNNHFRPDGSSFHLVSYDQKTGLVQYKKTVQGYADESAWARGQAWGLYGYTVCFRETGDSSYLNQAEKIAALIIKHPNLPEDKIFYWDFNAPNIPNALRDASAAAIAASALLELSQYEGKANKEIFIRFANDIIKNLCSEKYRSKPGENNNFLLKHCVGNLPANSEVDVPLSYADYYYVEALMRLHNIQQGLNPILQ